MALADEILSCDDSEKVQVKVPEWGPAGEKIWVRVMTGIERDSWEAALLESDGNHAAFTRGVRARLTQLTACDETGVLLFTPEQIPQLERKSGRALNRIFETAMKLNRLRKADLEELEKNSGSAPSGASGSSSPDTSAGQSGNASAVSVAENSPNGALTTA